MRLSQQTGGQPYNNNNNNDGVYKASRATRDIFFSAESRKVLNLPPVTIFPYQNLPQMFEVLVVDRAWLGRDSRYNLRENILVSFHMGLS